MVAAPALATLGSVLTTDPSGFAYSDFWDKSVLSPYAFDVDDNDHCPLLLAAEGFSRQVKLPSIIDFITDLQPLLLPFGGQLWAPVMTDSDWLFHSSLFPSQSL